ncbi:MAG: ABC transporter ATP-binding protein [Campylobacterales bacterium]|nr:ABC transporter ATP-binding protein [Campylobacterales bacterium]
MDKIISVKDLSFKYDKDLVLERINLTVEKKDFLAIIGPNGGGKSTLLKLLLGVLTPNEGQISLFDAPVQESFSKIGYVPQNTNINIDFPITVLEVVLMGHFGHKRPLIGYSKDEMMCARGALQQVGMEDYENKKIGSLSGGQRQRVMIARALCAHPKVLILDEPTSSIDVEGQQQIYNLIKDLNKQITVVVVSHDISVILGYATKVAYINKTISNHDLCGTKKDFETKDGHFCEVELLQMLGGCKC